MGAIAILLLNFCAFCLATGIYTRCLPEILKCSRYWRETGKDSVSSLDFFTGKYLNYWCRYQDQFYKCLEDVLENGKSSSVLPSTLLISKLFSQELCTVGSNSRKKLLHDPESINFFHNDAYPLPEVLELMLPENDTQSTRCLKAENFFSCMAATPDFNWRFDPGRVHVAIYQIMKDIDVHCGVVRGEGIQSGGKADGKRTTPSEIYGPADKNGNSLDKGEDESCSIEKDEVLKSRDDEDAEKRKTPSEIYSGPVNKNGNKLDKGEDQSELSDSASGKSTEDVDNVEINEFQREEL